MIPKITKRTCLCEAPRKCYIVIGKYGSDECYTLSEAIRYWLWHCGVPARIAFWRIKKE